MHHSQFYASIYVKPGIPHQPKLLWMTETCIQMKRIEEDIIYEEIGNSIMIKTMAVAAKIINNLYIHNVTSTDV